MNILSLTLAYLRARALNTALTVVTFATGVTLIVVVLLINEQLQNQFSRNLKGIDLVVGSKGSPLQLIMSSVFHLDIPSGTIPFKEIDKLRANPLVGKVIPLALGDNFQGFRIVGTTQGYAGLYQARLRGAGRFWTKGMEVVLGAEMASQTGLKTGDVFSGSHGLSRGGSVHAEIPYRVVGILEPSGTVLDRLALTAFESVWQIHGHDAGHVENSKNQLQGGRKHDTDHSNGGEDHAENENRVITSLLISYSSPVAAVILPNEINNSTSLLAASPSYEVARLNRFMGAGTDIMQSIAWFLVALAGVSIFAGLYSAMDERRYDLALMRSFGAAPLKLVLLLVVESLFIAFFGLAGGVVVGHGLVEVIGTTVSMARNLHVSGLVMFAGEAWLVVASLVIGGLAAMIPAIRVYRIDIYRTLVQR